MKGSIPRQFIDDLLTKSNIVDVINARVKLKKAGRDYQACCPFHHEKTPSFTVSEKKQFYYCFGCGAKGNAISFLMDYDKLEFVEAVEELAASAGLEVPYEKRPNQFGNKPDVSYQTKRNLYDLMQEIASFYQAQLPLIFLLKAIFRNVVYRPTSSIVFKSVMCPIRWIRCCVNSAKIEKNKKNFLI